MKAINEVFFIIKGVLFLAMAIAFFFGGLAMVGHLIQEFKLDPILVIPGYFGVAYVTFCTFRHD